MLINNLDKEKIIYITNNEIIFYDNSKKQINVKLDKLFDSICLNEMTTLKGRKEAIKILFGYHNNPPLYLTKNIVLIRVEDALKNTTVYLNVTYIKNIKQEGINCKVSFMNNTFLFLCVDIKYLNKQLEKAQKIINNSYNVNFV